MLRIIVLQALKHNFCFAAKHISGKSNTVCDYISRFQYTEARARAKYLRESPKDIPPELSPDVMLL